MNPTDYPILLIYSGEDNSWLGRVDLLPGCIADGATAEEALANAKVAIKEWLEINQELGRPVPAPLDVEGLDNLHLTQMQQQKLMIEQVIQQAISQYINQLQNLQISEQRVYVGGFSDRTLMPAIVER